MDAALSTDRYVDVELIMINMIAMELLKGSCWVNRFTLQRVHQVQGLWEGILLMIETVPGSKEQGAYRVTRDNNIDPD